MLTEAQLKFVNTYLRKKGLFKESKKDKKENREIEQKYEDYLVARARVSLRIQILDDTDPKKKIFQSNINGIDEKTKSRETLGEAILSLGELDRSIDDHVFYLEMKARESSPGGMIYNEIAKAVKQVADDVDEDRKAFTDLEKKITERSPELAGQDIPLWNRLNAERGKTVKSIYAVPHGDTDDIGEAKKSLASLRDDWLRVRGEIAELRNRMIGGGRALTSEIMSMEAVLGFRTALNSADQIIGELETWGAAAKFPKESGEMRAEDKTGADYADLKTRAEDLLRRVTEAKQEKVSDYAQASNALRNRMELLRKGLLEISKGDAKKEQRAQLENVISQCTLMLGSGFNTQALTPIRGLLDQGDQLLADLRNAKTINDEISNVLKDIAKEIKPHLGKSAIRSEDFARLNTELVDLIKNYMNQPLSAARSAAIDLHGRVTALVNEETAQQLWRKGALAKIKQQRKEFDQLSELLKPLLKQEGKKVEPYAGHLVDELDLAEDWATTKTQRSYESIVDGKLLAIQSECLRLIARLEGRSVDFTTDQGTGAIVNTDPGASKMRAGQEVLEDHAKGIEARSNEAADRKLFLQECTDFLQRLKDAQKTSPSVQSYPDEVKVIRKRIEDARGTVRKKKEGDAAGERRMLQSSETQLDNLLSRAPKLDTASLGKIGENWRQAMSVFDTKIGDLVRVAKEAAGTNARSLDAVGKLETQLGKIRSRFNPGDFDGPAGILGNAETAPSLRLRVREDVLSRVRANRELIEKDPLIRLCVANPFKVDRFVDGMRIKLKEIELEVLRGA